MATVSTGNGPFIASVRGDQAFTYVIHFDDGTVSAIDLATKTVIQTIATGKLVE